MKHKVDLSGLDYVDQLAALEGLEGLDTDGLITLDEPANTWHLHEAPEWEVQRMKLSPWAAAVAVYMAPFDIYEKYGIPCTLAGLVRNPAEELL